MVKGTIVKIPKRMKNSDAEALRKAYESTPEELGEAAVNEALRKTEIVDEANVEYGNCEHGKPVHYMYPCEECNKIVEVLPKTEVSWHCKLTDEWIPVPAVALQALGWVDDQELEIITIYGNQIVIRKKDALKD